MEHGISTRKVSFYNQLTNYCRGGFHIRPELLNNVNRADMESVPTMKNSDFKYIHIKCSLCIYSLKYRTRTNNPLDNPIILVYNINRKSADSTAAPLGFELNKNNRQPWKVWTVIFMPTFSYGFQTWTQTIR